MKYVRVDQLASGSFFCSGIFDDMRTALGSVYLDIDEFHDSYREEGCQFDTHDMFYLEDGGLCVEIEFKHPSWEESETERYMILEYEEKEEKQ